MARAAHLKVYRTPIGFHDAYVAAPSQKAALAAWGSAHDLFSTGEAELVDDPALTEEPLARPGEIVRRVRGTTAEHIAALPAEPKAAPASRRARPKSAATPATPPKVEPGMRATAKPRPRPRKPDDSAVAAARSALASAMEQQGREREALVRRAQDLKRERQAVEAAHKATVTTLRKTIKTVKADYDKALADWRRAST